MGVLAYGTSDQCVSLSLTDGGSVQLPVFFLFFSLIWFEVAGWLTVIYPGCRLKVSVISADGR